MSGSKPSILTSSRLWIVSAILALVLFIGLIAYAPDAVPLSTNNYGWNGQEQVYSSFSVHPINAINDATLSQDRSSVLLVVGPISNYSAPEASSALDFVKGGGTLVVADSTGYSNSLLSSIGSGIQIQASYALYDNLYNWKDSSLPTALILPSTSSSFSRILNRVGGVALNRPSPLEVSGSAIALAITSPNSFEASRLSGNPGLFQSSNNPTPIAKGPFTVGAIERIGRGTLVALGDSEFFTNQVIGIADNSALISNLLSNSSVFLDTSHWPPNTSAAIKAELASIYSRLAGPWLRYLLTLGIIGVAIGLTPLYEVFRKEQNKESLTNGSSPPNIGERDPKVIEKIRSDRERVRRKSPR